MKAYVTGPVMARRLTVLHGQLRGVARESQGVLYLDAFRAHWPSVVLQAMQRCKFVCCAMPAKLTWVLQPSDTHIFSVFKRSLKIQCQMGHTHKANGKLDPVLLVRSMCDSVAEVLEYRCWRQA